MGIVQNKNNFIVEVIFFLLQIVGQFTIFFASTTVFTVLQLGEFFFVSDILGGESRIFLACLKKIM